MSATPAVAHAGACCLSANAFGIGRLALWESFAVILGGAVAPVVGRWDEDARWAKSPKNSSELEWRPQLSALVALHRRLQVSARLPFVITQKSSDALHESGGGLGDSFVALRYEPVYQGEYAFLPEVAATLGVTIPSGRAAYATKTLLASDVTGRGAWVLSGAVTTELARELWFLQLGAGITVPLPAAVAGGQSERLGVGAQLSLVGGAELLKDLIASAVLHFASEGATHFAGKIVPKSQAYELGIGPAVAWMIDPNWTLQGAVDFALPASGLGENRQGRVAANLAVRYAYF